jgi:D-tyrosyl-tRNA(Tyr) deacylase
MRLFVQRVLAGSVTVEGEVVGRIDGGLVCLVGIHRNDTEADLDSGIQKLLTFCFFAGEDGTPWQRTAGDVGASFLLVSQFTLYARTCSGRRPDFSRSMGTDRASAVFGQFVDKLRAVYPPEKVQTGVFGAMMDVRVVNEGPTTFMFDSFNKAV